VALGVVVKRYQDSVIYGGVCCAGHVNLESTMAGWQRKQQWLLRLLWLIH